MPSSNPYYPILLHALRKEEIPIDHKIENYKKYLTEEAKENYNSIVSHRSFPYCLCSLSHAQVERAIEIEYISVTPRSMHIGLITCTDRMPIWMKSYSCYKGSATKRELAILRCECVEYKSIDWSISVHIKIVALLTDYKYKIMSTLTLLESVFVKNVNAVEAGDMNKAICMNNGDTSEIQMDFGLDYMRQIINNDSVKALLTSASITSGQSELVGKIIKNTRKQNSL